MDRFMEKKVIWLWMLLGMAVGVQGQAVSNGSFENGNLDGWTTVGGSFTPTDAYDSDEQVDGRWCLRVGSTGTAELRSGGCQVQRTTKLISFTAKVTGVVAVAPNVTRASSAMPSMAHAW